ncbi:MAG: glycosyltransferase, partial [Bacteroidales bacterium]|nr:glycosyltransferase [Bacteroidales bacterium]
MFNCLCIIVYIECKHLKVVTVIIINWNGKRFLEECLEALRNQSFQDFSVIVCDNGSIDGSA